MVDLDPVVRSNLARSAVGAAWIAGLGDVVSRLAVEWRFDEVGAPYAGGSHSLAAPVALRDGSRAVLKVALVDDENRLEAAALDVYAGDGAVQLFAFDEHSGAMLLEQAIPGDPLEHHPDRAEAIAIGCELLRRLRREAPDGHRFTLVADQACSWSSELATRLDEVPDPTARLLLSAAAQLAAELTTFSTTPVLVNRDAHLGNVLAAGREPWLLVDPKPLVGDAAFDAGYLIDWLLDDQSTPADAERIVSAVASGLAVDQERARDWAVVRAMENYRWALFDEDDDPAPYVAAAAALTTIA